eukprot:14041381-Alexandrium_andersonii.AAC.1
MVALVTSGVSCVTGAGRAVSNGCGLGSFRGGQLGRGGRASTLPGSILGNATEACRGRGVPGLPRQWSAAMLRVRLGLGLRLCQGAFVD